MGFPAQSLVHRMDNKLYKLQVCFSRDQYSTALSYRPLSHQWSARTCMTQYSVDDYPLGTNAVVAVISYTVSRHTVIWCVLNACHHIKGFVLHRAMTWKML